MKPWHWAVVAGIIIGVSLLASVVGSLILTRDSLTLLQSGQSSKAAAKAQQAQIFLQPLRAISAGKIHTLNAWQSGLQLVQIAPAWQEALITVPAQVAGNQARSSSLLPLFQETATLFDFFNAELQRSLIPKVLPDKAAAIKKLGQTLGTAQPVIERLLTGHHRMAVMLQNTDEIRATGGFMGSFILVELDDGKLTDWQLYDIYEPDGQFTGFIPAPTGVNEYLSEGKGWRLPDSNWNPDFPQTAKTIQNFLEKGSIRDVDYVAAINLTLLKNLLEITGPITLPDQNITLTSENSSELLRSVRGEFFAGSQAKKTVLQNLITHLSLSLQQLDATQQLLLLKLVGQSLATKDVQLFSQDQVTQSWLESQDYAGIPFPQKNLAASLLIGLVESNVGINKANSAVSRQVTINQLAPTTWSTQIIFTHDGSNALPYVNYQRFLLPATAKLEKIMVNTQPLENWDSHLLTLSSGQRVLEVGFLSVTPVAQISTTQIEFSLPFVANNASIFKQSGLPPSPYHIITLQGTHTFILEKDLDLQL